MTRRNRFGARAAIFFLAATASLGAASAQSPAPPPAGSPLEIAWRRFPVFVWFYGGPPRGKQAFEVLARHGLDACNVEAEEQSDGARASGLGFYVDHLAGKGDLYLRQPGVDRDHAELLAHEADLRPARPVCLNDPDVIARLEARVRSGVARQARNAPLCYVLDDELSVTRGVNPMDYCFDERCLDALRQELRQRYGTIAALNAAWGSAFARFEVVVPPTTGEARRAAAGKPLARVSFAGWNDHREFMEHELARRVGELAELARSLAPGVPIGFTGGEPPSAFGGFDWRALLEHLTLVEAYEHGAAPELARSLASRGTKVISTLFVPTGAEAAGFTGGELLVRAARGDDGAVIWSSGAIFEPDGKELNAAGRALADVVAEVRKVKAALADATPLPARALLLVSQPSIRAGWMLDSWEDGKTWPNRLTSYELEHSSGGRAREAWTSLLRALAIPFGFCDLRDFCDPRGLAAAQARGSARVAILSEAAALSDAEVESLERFVEEGGLLIGDTHAALFDERVRGRTSDALERLFGVRRAEPATIDEVARGFASSGGTAAELGARRGEQRCNATEAAAQGSALGFSRAHGRGRSIYLDLRVSDLAGGARIEGLRALAEALSEPLVAAHAAERFPRLEPGRGLRLERFQSPRGELALIVADPPVAAPLKARLLFGERVRVADALEDGKPSERATDSIDVEIGGTRAALLRWRKGS